MWLNIATVIERVVDTMQEQSGKRILVVDDDEQLLEMLETDLRGHGHEVSSLQDGSLAAQTVRNSAPDLVVMDIIMPNVEGIEAISEIRQFDEGIPIIVMSGGGKWIESDVILDMANSIGATRILAKPFRLTELREMMDDIFEAA